MNTSDFSNIVQTLFIDKEAIPELERLSIEFPYCQSIKLILAKAYHSHNDILAETKLRNAAVYASDRSQLKKIILDQIPVTVIEPSPVIEPEKTEENKKETTPLEPEQNSLTEEVKETVIPTPPLKDEPSKKVDLIPQDKETIIDLESVRETIVTKDLLRKKKKESAKADKKPIKQKKKSSTKKIEALSKKVKEKNDQEKIKSLYLPPINNSRYGEILMNGDEEVNADRNDIEFVSSYLDYLQNKRAKAKKESNWQENIISSFIQKDPSISKLKPTNKDKQEDLAVKSVKPVKKIITENLALINARQGNIKKAIEIYEALILKSPNKKTYFAAQIEKLKKQ